MVAQATGHPAARLLRAISDPFRFRLLRELPVGGSEEIPVGELARRLGVSDALVSQHLRVLAGAGLVSVTRRGRSASYFVKPDAVEAARESLATAWPTLFAPRDARPQLSARNQLYGRVVEVKRGDVTSEVALDIGGQVLTGVITNASVQRLGLEAGAVAAAVIKSTDVMFLK